MEIAAVVVTFNRLELLKECIESIRNQTYKVNEIFVINNSSNDGTLEWLNLQKDLTVITQENLGGAGGFYTGIRSAYERGYDWIWCMDDDCISGKNALAELMPFLTLNKRAIYNSLVVSKENNNKLAFGLYDSVSNKYIDRVILAKDKLLKGSANFFNGTIVPNEFIKKCGLPLKALFIRGDEYEYFLRAQNNGVEVISVSSSIIYHPSEVSFLIENNLFRYKFLYMNNIKRYYLSRNMVILKRLYRQIKQESVVKKIILDSLCIIFLERTFRNLFCLFEGVFNGIFIELKEIENKENV